MRVDINTSSAMVSVKALYEATRLIQNGALASQMINATFKSTDKRFNTAMAGMAAGGEIGGESFNISHMYDWGMIGAPTGRLWETYKTGQGSKIQVSFFYLPSKRKVPLDEVLLEAEEEGDFKFRRHVFKSKAMAFETGVRFQIKRKQSDWLVWAFRGTDFDPKKRDRGNAGGTRFSVERGIAFSQGVSDIRSGFGGGQFRGNFNQAFLLWWTTPAGIGVSAKEISRRLESSSHVRMARTVAETRRLSAAKATMSDSQATAHAKKMAQSVIRKIEGDLN